MAWAVDAGCSRAAACLTRSVLAQASARARGDAGVCSCVTAWLIVTSVPPSSSVTHTPAYDTYRALFSPSLSPN